MPNLPRVHNPRAPGKRHSDPIRDAQRQAKVNRTTKQRQDTRQLPTNSALWIKIRRSILQKEPFCRNCKESEGYLILATEIDHIDGDASSPNANRADNLQPLCKPCHSRKTARENK